MTRSIPLEILRNLTPMQRKVLLYREAGLQYRDIGKRVSRSVDYVGAVLYYARQRAAIAETWQEGHVEQMSRLEDLPKSLADVARLRLAGWRNMEVAEKLGLTRGLAATRWFRAQFVLTGRTTPAREPTKLHPTTQTLLVSEAYGYDQQWKGKNGAL